MGIRASKGGSNVGKQGIGVLEEVWDGTALPIRPLEARESLFLIGVIGCDVTPQLFSVSFRRSRRYVPTDISQCFDLIIKSPLDRKEGP